MHKKEKEKLQKRIAQAGIASRREAERLIEAGRIKVNGRIATLGERVAPNDKIEVDGRVIDAEKLQQAPTEVLLYHKPEGYICSRKDDKGRPIIFEQLPKRHHGRWINVGRLDVIPQACCSSRIMASSPTASCILVMKWKENMRCAFSVHWRLIT